MTAAGPSLLDDVTRLLLGDGWEVFESRTKPALLILVHGEDGTMTCQVEARDGGQSLIARVVFPSHVKESRLHIVTEYISRASRVLHDQQFVLDPEEGTLALETVISLRGAQARPADVRQSLVDLISAADRHLDGVRRLLYDPAAAIDGLDSVRRMTAW